jgi:hypothetical protein
MEAARQVGAWYGDALLGRARQGPAESVLAGVYQINSGVARQVSAGRGTARQAQGMGWQIAISDQRFFNPRRSTWTQRNLGS